MFKPNFTLSTDLLNSITNCARIYGQLEALRMPKEVEINLERDNQVMSSFASNSIEGNPLSLPEVTNLLLDERVPVNRDEKEVVNYFNILRSLNSYLDQPIDLPLILEFHKNLLTGVNDKIAGKIRNKPIFVGRYKTEAGIVDVDIKHTPPAHEQASIKQLLNDLFSWLNKSEQPAIIKAAIFHHQFVYIHPFEDGNGRTCRLLTALILMQQQFLINKYFVLDDYYDVDRTGYSDALNSADDGDQTQWLDYFTKGMLYSLQSSLSRVNSAINNIKVSQRPTKRENDALNLLQQFREMTSTDIAQKLNISRQQAHNLLTSLINKGYIAKEGETKATYYFLK